MPFARSDSLQMLQAFARAIWIPVLFCLVSLDVSRPYIIHMQTSVLRAATAVQLPPHFKSCGTCQSYLEVQPSLQLSVALPHDHH
jgi:hypothetical protein